MIRFDIITIFPEVFSAYLDSSILGRARKKKLIKTVVHNVRDFTNNKHKKIDDKPYGGGPGMVMMAEPIYRAVKYVKVITRNKKSEKRIILLSTRGKKLNTQTVKRLITYKQLIFICGHYEGVDERVAKYIADEEISIGDYVLTGGELPAMIVVDAISRYIPGVLGAQESLEESRGGVGIPAYTRPESLLIDKRNIHVPKVLLSGDHKKIAKWRIKHKI